MKIIKILGTGCSNCKILEFNVKSALKSLNLEVKVEKIEDIEKIMAYNIMGTPGLVIDDKVISSGKILSIEELKKIFKNNN